MAEGLKPCPFCGKETELVTKEINQRLDDIIFPMFQVVCSMQSGMYAKNGCGAASGWRLTEEEAVRAWNRRAESCKQN